MTFKANHCRVRRVRVPFLALLAALSLLSSCRPGGGRKAAPPEPAVDTMAVLVTRMERCSRLYTSEYRLRKILVYDNPAVVSGSLMHRDFKISLPLGERRIAIPVTATAKACVDMGKLAADGVRRNGDRLEITLPDPDVTLTSTRVDHEGVRQKVALLRSRFTDEEITRVQRQGRDDMVRELARTGIVEDARASAARQLIPMAVRLGFKEENVTVTFRKDLTAGASLQSIIRIVD